MPRIEKRIKTFTSALSILLAATITAIGAYLAWGTPTFDEFFFFAIIAAFTPPTIANYLDYRWRRSIDEHLPDMFRSIVQAQETGMTLPRAFEEAAKRDYGPLTAELRKINVQISWGMTLEEALLAFAKRVDTLLVRRVVPLIVEANRSGGYVERVFEPLGKFIQSTLMLQKERRNRTRPYIAIIYVAFFVFIFTIVMLFKSFFVDIEGISILGAAVMTPEEMKRLMFHMTMIQAFFSGLVAGKMGEGIITAGLKHSLVLMLCGYLAIKFFL